jgi:hypothetical protein
MVVDRLEVSACFYPWRARRASMGRSPQRKKAGVAKGAAAAGALASSHARIECRRQPFPAGFVRRQAETQGLRGIEASEQDAAAGERILQADCFRCGNELEQRWPAGLQAVPGK